MDSDKGRLEEVADLEGWEGSLAIVVFAMSCDNQYFLFLIWASSYSWPPHKNWLTTLCFCWPMTSFVGHLALRHRSLKLVSSMSTIGHPLQPLASRLTIASNPHSSPSIPAIPSLFLCIYIYIYKIYHFIFLFFLHMYMWGPLKYFKMLDGVPHQQRHTHLQSDSSIR